MNPLLRVENLSVRFPFRGGRGFGRHGSEFITAVDGVSLDLGERETLGVVGESGSGKTTLVRAVVGTVPIHQGRILWRGSDLAQASPSSRQQVRREISMIFQNPLASLNPSMTVGQIIAEPYRIHQQQASVAEIRKMVGEAMEWVGLTPGMANRYPHEFSGGQCQRVGIARALISRPKLMICDEPVASLDVSIRAQIVNLLKQLQDEFGISLIMISHDLSVIRHISHRIMVMYLGNVMETVGSGHLLARSRHPYTRILIESVPVPDPKIQKSRRGMVIQGDPPSMKTPPPGCRFATRCPIVRADCSTSRPELLRAGPDHWLACPHAEETPA